MRIAVALQRAGVSGRGGSGIPKPFRGNVEEINAWGASVSAARK